MITEKTKNYLGLATVIASVISLSLILLVSIKHPGLLFIATSITTVLGISYFFANKSKTVFTYGWIFWLINASLWLTIYLIK